MAAPSRLRATRKMLEAKAADSWARTRPGFSVSSGQASVTVNLAFRKRINES